MKKFISELGKTLSKVEQKNVLGGGKIALTKHDSNCDRGQTEGTCWGYSPDGMSGFDVMEVGGGGSGSGYYTYACPCY